MTVVATDGRRDRFVREAIGVFSEPQRHDILRTEIEAYALAIGRASRCLQAAPPLFVVVAAFDAASAVVRRFDRYAERAGAGLGLHEAQDMRVYRPLVPGEAVWTRSAVIGVRVTPLGAKVMLRTETSDAQRKLVALQLSTTYFADVRGRESLGNFAQPLHPIARVDPRASSFIERESVLSRELALAYAAASNDREPIHIDDEAARRLGQPGIVIHGMCVLAIVCEQFYDAFGKSANIGGISVHFAKPAFPGTTMVTRFYVANDDAVAFEVRTQDGTPLLRRGILSLS